MSAKESYDLLVVGAGPGGYVAAIRAAQLGMRAAIIERDKPGGVCLNVGCIPSKALIHQAGLFRAQDDLAAMGLTIDRSGFNYAAVQKRSREAADRLSQGIAYLLKKNKIDWIAGDAVGVRAGEVELADGTVYHAASIILATGSRPREIPGFAFDGKTILNSTDVLMMQKLPGQLLVLGSGAIGVEFSHIFNAFGVKVHLVEMLDRILPLEDEENVRILDKSFRKRGIEIRTSTKAISWAPNGDQIDVRLEGADGTTTLTVDQVLVSAGRVPNTDGLRLAEAGIETDPAGFVQVGDYGLTSVPGIYAIGDMVRTPLLAHVASREGEIATEHAAGKAGDARIDPLSIPAATYCEPQVSSFGLTEKQAVERNLKVTKLLFPYRAIGKAVASDQTEGQIKILLDAATGELVGAHIVGAESTELIHQLLLVRSGELLAEDVIRMVHAHPTLSEGILEAMRGAAEGPIHI